MTTRGTRRRLPSEDHQHRTVLVTVLYQRGIAVQEALAELFGVSRRSIGEAIKEVGPLLSQHDFTPAPNASHFTSADIVLQFLTDLERNPTRTT